jgi:hypothetical protein
MQGVTAPVVDYSRDLKPLVLRALQEVPAEVGYDQVTYVATATELVNAMYAKARHIEITEHLDLTAFIDTYDPFGNAVSMHLDVRTWSIRVRSKCSTYALYVADNRRSASSTECVLVATLI